MIIKVKVFPKSGREEVIKLTEENYKVYLKKSPEDNKANIELIKSLSKYFNANIKVIKGLKSRDKIIDVEKR